MSGTEADGFKTLIESFSDVTGIIPLNGRYVHAMQKEISCLMQKIALDEQGNTCIEIAAPGRHAKHMIRYDEVTDYSEPLHTHACFLLTMILDGSSSCDFGNHNAHFQKGQCFFMNRNVPFRESYGHSTTIVFLLLDLELLRYIDEGKTLAGEDTAGFYRLLSEFLESDTRDVDNKIYFDFVPCREDAIELLNERSDRLLKTLSATGNRVTYDLLGRIYDLLLLLMDSDCYLPTKNTLTSSQQENLYYKILQLISLRKGRISREELSSLLNYNGEYLNQVARKYSGKNLTELKDSALLHAFARDLSETDIPVGQLLDRYGITNHSHFYRKFKEKYGVTPRKYR